MAHYAAPLPDNTMLVYDTVKGAGDWGVPEDLKRPTIAEPQNIENIHREEEDTLTEWEIEICESRVIAGNMRDYGGGFVKKLGEALFLADRFNTQRIKNAFPEYWNQYLNWGK